MTPVFYEIAHKVRTAASCIRATVHTLNQLRDSIKSSCQSNKEVDVLHWISRAALEAVAQGGMGTNFDLFSSKDATHPMLEAVKNIMCVEILETKVSIVLLIAHHTDPS